MTDVTAVLMYKVRPSGGVRPQTVGFEGGGITTIVFECCYEDAVEMAKQELESNSANLEFYQFTSIDNGDTIKVY